MSSVDWPAVDANAVSLPTIVSSSDLFDGELFGDELIDIYNSSVDDGTENGLPLLLAPPSDKPEDDHHIGLHVANTAAAMDDGLGAFRPSTSFNDLTTLLPPMAQSGVPATPVMAPLATTPGTTKGTKKRAASISAADGPATKKKAAARSAKRSGASLKKQAAAAVTAAVAAAPTTPAPLAAPKVRSPVAKKPVVETKASKDTPNPLNEEVTQQVPKTIATVAAVPVKIRVAAPVPEPVAAPIPGSGCSIGSINSETDFKTIAQAAVTSLIQNAATSKDAPAATVDSSFEGPVDTSTAHIKALTGNNWVAACSTNVAGVAPVSAATDSKANNRARRQNLTPDERARQNRDRNREHARNTRLRKKAYVDELKRTLTELVVQRDAADAEKRQAAQRELEQREVRFRVIEEFLKLRGRNEANVARWSAILEEGFSLTLPVTDFRKMVRESVEGSTDFEQCLAGVSEVMADAANFSTFLQSLSKSEAAGAVSFQYHCDRKKFFMDGCNAVMEWTATSVGAVSKGSTAELTLKGIIRGNFSPASNKLLSANMSFNTGSVAVQLPQMKGGNPEEVAAAAAQAAATQADALLDSLQMPCLLTSQIPSAVTVMPSSISSSDQDGSDGHSLDESVTDEKMDTTTAEVQGVSA